MIKQNVFIIKLNSLYEIFDEIKENLYFKIFNFENEDNFIKASNLDTKNCLVISETKKKLLENKNLTEKNILNINIFPTNLERLLELINIRLIKLRFNYQSKVNIKDYELDLNSKFFSKNNLILKLTEKEVQIILYLNNYETMKNILDLQKNIWGYKPEMETHTVETHIYRLRKKISDKFNDKNFILSEKNGYFINKIKLI